MQNRRKYDRTSVHDLLEIHEEKDMSRFEGLEKRFGRIEMAQYIAAGGLALFIYLIDHPKVIENLASDNEIISTIHADQR